LVKELEKSGIGRPSTYATIMNKIQSREYTVKESGRLKPTELGRVIALLLENNFQQIMNIGFTAAMEDNLELVAENRKDWKELIRDFWSDFSPTLEIAEKEGFVPKIMTDIECPRCHIGKLQKVWFKTKYFYGCSRYPECTYSAPLEEIDFNKEDYAEDFDWNQRCPVCHSEMKVRHGRFGAFLGCVNYPNCKGIVNIPKKGEKVIAKEDMPHCPAIGCEGHMVMRKSRFGKTFYSCSTFPNCDVIVNDLSQLQTKYVNHPKTAYVKKNKKGGKALSSKQAPKAKREKTEAKAIKSKKSRAAPLNRLSPELAAIMGAEELSRGEVMKKIWEYIKAHGLQDSTNKRLINPDEKLTKLFGSQEPVDMFKMTALISKHILRG
jgi:DNA topoisomerase I